MQRPGLSPGFLIFRALGNATFSICTDYTNKPKIDNYENQTNPGSTIFLFDAFLFL